MLIRVYASKKTLKIIIACCITALVILNSIFIPDLINQSKYVECSATVTGTDFTVNDDGGRTDYMIISYTYNDHNYNYKQQFMGKMPYNTGENIKIKVNPENPQIISDSFRNTVFIVIDIILFLWTVMMFIFLQQKSKSHM